jgi:hypothetical protein
MKTLSVEERVLRGDQSEEEFVEMLRRTKEALGAFYPVLKDQDGDVIDGFHRLEADPDWPTVTVSLKDKALLHVARLVTNWRRDVSPEEKSRGLAIIAERKGWGAREISENLGIPYTTVVKYLPDKYKDASKVEAGKIGGERKALELATRRVAEKGLEEEAEEAPEAPAIRHAAEPEPFSVEPRHVLFVRGLLQRFEKASDDYLASSLYGRFGLSREEADKVIEAARGETGVKPPRPPRVESDMAEFVCGVCRRRFLIVHVEPTGEHKLKEVLP